MILRGARAIAAPATVEPAVAAECPAWLGQLEGVVEDRSWVHGVGHRGQAAFSLRRCPSTVSCTVPSGESPNFRWIPS